MTAACAASGALAGIYYTSNKMNVGDCLGHIALFGTLAANAGLIAATAAKIFAKMAITAIAAGPAVAFSTSITITAAVIGLIAFVGDFLWAQFKWK